MDVVVSVLLVIVGLINAAPGVAAVVPGALGRAYCVDIADPNLTMLLRHRAVLLFIVGAALIVAGFIDPLRVAAMIGGAVSMVSYVVVVLAGGANQRLRRVAYVDVVALILLVAAAMILGLS